MDDATALCYMLVLIFSIAFLVWGFMDLLKKPSSGSASMDTISRQLRGFAFIMLSQVILVLGSAICFKAMGGMKSLGGALGRAV